MSEKFAVRLVQPVEPSSRSEKANKVAPRFGVGADKVEKLLSRNPGVITKPTTQAEAERVAAVFSSVGVVVEVINLDPKPEAIPVVSATPATKPETVVKPVVEDPSPDRLQAAPHLSTSAPSNPEPKAVGSSIDTAVRESVVWASAPTPTAERSTHIGAVTPKAAVPAGVEDGLPDVAKTKVRRFSLRWKLLIAAITPIIFLVATTLYIADSSINKTTTFLLAKAGDNLALTLASEMSLFIAENNLDLSIVSNRNQLAIHFVERLNAVTPTLHEIIGIHLTDESGNRLAGVWGPQLHQYRGYQARRFPFNLLPTQTTALHGNPERLREIEDRFRDTTQKAITNANYGDKADELAQSLPSRTVIFESFYMIGVPLQNGVGAIQVILTEENIADTSSTILQPIVITAGIALLLTFLVMVVLAIGLSRNIRRLAAVADRISLGELDEPVEIKGNDEIRDVAEALERMRVSLQSAINRLRKRGRK